METAPLDVVTGALSYTGKYVARRLLSIGKRVRTLTGHPDRDNPFDDQVGVAPFNFQQPDRLVESLRGAATLYNTYWIRFSHGDVTFDRAVENSRTLISAAVAAGIRRVVHLSITNAAEDSSLPYFRAKAMVERAIVESGLSYAILRPTVIFGPEDILINNIAWLLRRFPVFAIPGSGHYRLQPVYVGDVADIAVDAGHQDSNMIIDAVGPEVYTFDGLVRVIAEHTRSRARIVHVPAVAALTFAKLIGRVLGDVVLTTEELEGLMSNLLVSTGQPTGRTQLKSWLRDQSEIVGTHYASELDRHYR